MEVFFLGGGGRLYTYRYTVATRMTYAFRMGSDESHFNVSEGSDGQSHKTVSTTTTFLKREESRSGIEPRSFRLPA